MGKIQLLDIEVANLIAAGEVVDRPSSVVKELLENAIDAGASAVTLEIRAGGIGMIRVTDNGCGMSEEDLPTAIKRHATSKIRSADDLARIGTLGFRGEALAAIAAVSDMHIISKRKEDEYGHVLTASDGRILGIEEVGCADGTVMLIENLFARIPARRKFLKKDTTEAQSISAVAEKIAMSHPEIAFTFINQDQVKFKTQGDGVLLHTLHALLGKDVSSRLIAIEGGSLGVRVHGFVGRSDAVRGNRNAQNFFLNGRYIKSRTVMAALERAFVSYVAPEKFPIAAIFITVDPSAVDVNVHPTKLEIKFSDEKLIFESVYYAVRAALEENTSRPALTFKENRATNQVSPRAEGEEKAGLNCGTENCWAINSQASEADQQATMDFMVWCVTDPEASRMLVDTFGVMPYKQAATSTNGFLAAANDYAANGCYVMDWATNYQPNVDAYRAALVSALNAYNADQSEENWASVVTAFVDGWAVQYQAANN